MPDKLKPFNKAKTRAISAGFAWMPLLGVGITMAQLILTEEEKNLEKWSDFDNDALVKLARFSMLKMKSNDEQLERLHCISAAYLLVFAANATNATKLTQTLDDVTFEGKLIGDWKITVEKVNA